MTFAYILQPPFDQRWLAAATLQQRDVFQRHGAYLEDLHARGIVRFAGRCDGGPSAFVVIEVADEAEARRVMDQDPSVDAGVQQAELYPFVVFLERP